MEFPNNPHSIEEYFGRSTDDKGHSNRLQVRVPPDMARIVGEIVATGKTPYKTASDLARDAIWHRLGDIVPTLEEALVRSLWSKLNSVRSIIELETTQAEIFTMVETLDRTLLSLDNRKERSLLVKRIKIQVDGMPECYWKERALKTIGDRYGEYIS